MKYLYIIMFTLIISFNCWGQKTVKDSLFFKFDCNYIIIKKNYENIHSFIFKKEKIVSSAFGKKVGIIEDTLFYFAQYRGESITYNFKPKKIYNLRKFLKKKPDIFKDRSTKKLDAYKMMKFFDKYAVYFLMENGEFIRISIHASLQE